MYESPHKPLLPRKHFVLRLLKSLCIALLFILFSLFIGMGGYHWIAGLGWIDSLYNASMILAGMGPVDILSSDAAKIFASGYAIFSGVAFLSVVGILVAPVVHRFLHKFHIQDRND